MRWGVGNAARAWLLLAVCLPVCVHAGVTADEADAFTFKGRTVAEVLARFESRGYQFLYSSGTVRRGMTFSSEPAGGEPIARLAGALLREGLRLVRDSSNAFRIIRQATGSATDTPAVVGRVVDADTGRPIEGALVEIGAHVMVTNRDGEFRLPGVYGADITLSHDSYQPRQVAADLAAQALLEVSLQPAVPLEEMVVVSSRYAVRDIRTRSNLVDLELLDSLPRLAEDPVRLTHHLPGMATVGVSAKPHIRGGLQDEVLVLFNNLELLEPFHLRDFQSVFSSFNPSVIDSIDVYTGGFPARYGDRMSGVMDIATHAPPGEGRGELALSFLNTGVLLHGGNERRHWVVSARRGNLDLVTRQINSSVGEPSYADAYAQFRYQLDSGAELDLGLIAYNDDVELRDFDVDGEIASSEYRNLYGWAQLHRNWSEHLEGSTLLYFGEVSHQRDGFLVDEDLDNGRADVLDERAFSIISLGQEFRYRLGDRAMAEFGAKVTRYDGEYDYAGQIQRGLLADLLGTQLNESRSYRLRPGGSSGGIFFSLRGEVAAGLSLEGGLRWDYQSYGLGSGDNHVSPRVSARWKASSHSEFRFSLGRFYQPEAIHELQIGDGQTRFQAPQHSDLASLSWYWSLPRGFAVRSEVFYKRIEDPKRRFENLFNPLVLLPELASDRIAVIPAEARVRGVEVTVKYDPGEHLLAWLSYTRSKAEDRVDGEWVPRTWDQGHSIAAGLSYDGRRWKAGAALIWHDGWRTTSLPAMTDLGGTVAFTRNDTRLRDYLSLDVQVSRTWQWPRQSLTAFVEVTNALSRHNIGGIEFEVEDTDDSGYQLIPTGEKLLPLVPSLGLRWQF